MTDYNPNIVTNPIAFFRLKSTESSSRTSVGNIKRAIDSLLGFVGDDEVDFDSFDESLLGEWAAHQLFYGYFTKTVGYNISKIAALYNKAVEEGFAQPNYAFSKIINRVNDSSSVRFDGIKHKDTFQQLQSIIRTDYSGRQTKQLAKDMLLFAVYNGGLTFEQIGTYKKSDYMGDDNHILDIVTKYSKPKTKFLFPLNQAHSTPKQLYRRIEELLYELLSDVNLKLSGIPTYTTINLWCDVAMSCGISASEIAACIEPYCHINALTAFVKPLEIDNNRKIEILRLVTTSLTDNPIHWYAMHLRKHVNIDMITERLKEKEINLPEIYYPMEEIFNKVGNKKVFECRPIISWLLFFRERVTGLNRLYREIGDLAWGYRQERDVKSPYASISDKAILDYKEAIGTLGPDTPLISDDAVTMNQGDYLIILGGALNGRPAVFISDKSTSKSRDGNKIVYRVKLSGGKNANWIVDWDPRLVRKITEAQYTELERQSQSNNIE